MIATLIRSSPSRLFFLRLMVCLALLLGAPFALAEPTSDGMIDKGQRVFICGHSFHVFVEKPLAQLAAEAGKTEHADLGASYIGGSYPMQHWKLPDEKNSAKAALNSGNVDVFTLALNRDVPDEGVEKFANLAAEKDPGIRVMLQVSWMPWDGFEEKDFKKPEDHDRASEELLKKLEVGGEQYMTKLRDQVNSIDKRLNKDFVFIVPVGAALLQTRRMILDGKIPGLVKQSDLFTDGMGHPKQPLKNLAAFCWFAAIYRQSPVGLTALDIPNDKTSKAMNRVLQEVAWQAVTQEPLSGVKAKTAKVDR